jgi:hypothetical protein
MEGEKDKKEDNPPEPKDTPDFYWENGFMVFTREYHLRRGYCCRSGCRHCPYGFKKEENLPDVGI